MVTTNRQNKYKLCKTEQLLTSSELWLMLTVSKGLVLALHRLEWDSDLFQLPCFELILSDSTIKSSSLKNINDFPDIAVWAKLPVDTDQQQIVLLESIGFNFIETEITLKYQSSDTNISLPDSYQCFKTQTLDHKGYEQLGLVFSQTRFHTDTHISEIKANQLWSSYLRNYQLSDNRYAFMVVHLATNKVEGVVLINELDKSFVIDIVAISKHYRSKGLGSYLVQYVIEQLNYKTKDILVSTQHRNIKAINFYIRNGFTYLYSNSTVMHWWSNDETNT